MYDRRDMGYSIVGEQSNDDELKSLVDNRIAALTLLDYDKYLTELSSVGVALDEDPSTKGLTNLNLKIAKVDAQKTRVGIILNLALKNEEDSNAVLNFVERVCEARRSELLLNQDWGELKVNQALREAAVSNAMRELLNIKVDVEILVAKAKTFTKMVKQVFEGLDSTNKNISRQLTAIQTMLETGEIQRVGGNRNFNDCNTGYGSHTTTEREEF